MSIKKEFNTNQIIQMYNKTFNLEDSYPCKTFLTDDIYSERLMLCNSESERNEMAFSKKMLQDFSGLLVHPDEYDSTFYILIKSNLINDITISYKTFSHEYTHLIDYFECKEKFNLVNMRVNESIPDSECFQFYSEIRARFRASFIFYNLKKVDVNILVEDYNTQLVPEYKILLSKDLYNFESMYMLAQFYGQLIAISYYSTSLQPIPEYILEFPVEDLLLHTFKNITNLSIFDNYELIRNAYNVFMSSKKSQTANPL